MAPLKVGVIGTGMAFERLHLPAYRQLADRYQLWCLCDDEIAKARTWGERLGIPPERIYEDFRKMVRRDDLDVIDIMVPIELNYAVTRAVAEEIAGSRKGIVCEKPLAATLEEAEEARRLPERYGIPILIAENYRYNQEIDYIRDWVRTGRIGRAVYFIQNRVVDAPAEMHQDTFLAREWRQHPEFPGGVILDTGVHDIAALRHIFGAIDRVHAFGVPQEEDFSPYAVLQANLLFKSGLTGQFTLFTAGKEMQRPLIGLRIFGTRGEIYLEERDAGTLNIAYGDGRTEQVPYQPQQGFVRELLNFYNVMTGVEPPSVPPEMEFGDVKTILAMLESARTGQVVPVDRQAAYELR